MDVVYVVERGTATFQAARTAVDIVCAGDSLTESFCDEHGIPLADICCLLRDEHFGDELHPNDWGAKIIADAVFQVLPKE
jgi:lysophospholipase L1-like esterase